MWVNTMKTEVIRRINCGITLMALHALVGMVEEDCKVEGSEDNHKMMEYILMIVFMEFCGEFRGE